MQRLVNILSGLPGPGGGGDGWSRVCRSWHTAGKGRSHAGEARREEHLIELERPTEEGASELGPSPEEEEGGGIRGLSCVSGFWCRQDHSVLLRCEEESGVAGQCCSAGALGLAQCSSICCDRNSFSANGKLHRV